MKIVKFLKEKYPIVVWLVLLLSERYINKLLDEDKMDMSKIILIATIIKWAIPACFIIWVVNKLLNLESKLESEKIKMKVRDKKFEIRTVDLISNEKAAEWEVLKKYVEDNYPELNTNEIKTILNDATNYIPKNR